MSSHVYDGLPDRDSPQAIWSGLIATTPVDFAETVAVLIPGLSNELQWEECKWQSRNDIDMPTRGDKCLVAFDENNEIWVVAWWPY